MGALRGCATGAELSACVDTLWLQGNEGICVICQEELKAGEDGTVLRACGHTFHEECVQGWLLGCKRECPLCKEQLAPWPPRESPLLQPGRTPQAGLAPPTEDLPCQLSSSDELSEPEDPAIDREMDMEMEMEESSDEEDALQAAIALSLEMREAAEAEVAGMEEEDADIAQAIAASLGQGEGEWAEVDQGRRRREETARGGGARRQCELTARGDPALIGS